MEGLFIPSASAVADSVFLTAAIGLVPLVAFFVLLGVFKLATHWCALGALAISALSAVVFFGMPASLVGLSALQGLTFGIAPILYIVVAAVWLYNLSVASGWANDVRTVFSALGRGDQRVQALLVAFSFGALLEGLAGFGAPVAIVGAMLVMLGLPPLKAAMVTMVGNALSVGFGAMGIPTTTAGRLADSTGTDVALIASALTPWIAILVPFLILGILDGSRGIRQLWHVAFAQGLTMGLGHFFTVRVLTYELAAVLAGLFSFIVAVGVVRMVHIAPVAQWQSKEVLSLPPMRNIILGFLPYLLVVVVFGVAKLWRIGIDIPALLASTEIAIEWPGLYGRLGTANGEVSQAAVYNLQWLSSPGTLIVVTVLIVAAVYSAVSTPERQMTMGRAFGVFGETLRQLSWSLVTIALVMALAYVMNFSGQTTAIGTALATTGSVFAFLSPLLGWVGTAVTGSATSSNALFANLQASAAHGVGVDPNVFVAANNVGGGIGKIVSSQNLAIAATAVGGQTSEAEILRKVAPWSVGLILFLGVLTTLASLGWLPFV